MRIVLAEMRAMVNALLLLKQLGVLRSRVSCTKDPEYREFDVPGGYVC